MFKAKATIASKYYKVQILIGILVLILIPLICLLGLSAWVADDYTIALPYRGAGFNAIYSRIWNWSPRPISEIILFAYYKFVEQQKNSFAAYFLLLMWAFSYASIFISLKILFGNPVERAPVLSTHSTSFPIDGKKKFQNVRGKNSYLALISLLLFVNFLFVSKPSEIFYVPVVSAAYLPTISGVILITSMMLKVLNSPKITISEGIILIICGILTAFSSEVGSFYLLILSSTLLLALALHYIKFIPIKLTMLSLDNWGYIKLSIINIIYFLMPSLVFFSLFRSRVGKAELNSLDSPIAGNIKSSLILATQKVIEEIVLLGQTDISNKAIFASFSYSLAIKLLLLITIVTILIQAKLTLPSISYISVFVLGASLIATNFVIILAAYYQFGELCCDRHLHFRSILLSLIVFNLGVAIVSRSPSDYRTGKSNHGMVSMKRKFIVSNWFTLTVTTTFLVLLINLQIKSINNDFNHFNAIYSINKRNWSFNTKTEILSGKFHNFPAPHYAISFGMPTGIYKLNNQTDLIYLPHEEGKELTSGESHYVKAYMKYFQKEELFVY